MSARRVVRLGVSAALLLILGSCGGTSGSTGGGGNPTVSSVDVSVNKTSLTVGDTTQATCTVHMSDGTSTGACSFASSKAAVATVNASGLVTAVAAGSADITATSTKDTTKNSSAITVTVAAPASITSVSVTAQPSSITTAQTSACTAKVDGTGAYNSKVTWTATGGTLTNITDTSATFTPSGVGTGSCKATSVQDTSQSASVSVTITQAPPTVSGISAQMLYLDGPGPIVAFTLTGANFTSGDIVTISAPGEIGGASLQGSTSIQVLTVFDSQHFSPGWFSLKVCESDGKTCSKPISFAFIGNQNELVVSPVGELYQNDEGQSMIWKFKVVNGATVADGNIPSTSLKVSVDDKTHDLVAGRATDDANGNPLTTAQDDGGTGAYVGQDARNGLSACTRPFGNPKANLLSSFAVGVQNAPLSSIELGVEPWTVAMGLFGSTTHAYVYSRNGTPTLWDVDASDANLLGSVAMPFTDYATIQKGSVNGGWEIVVFDSGAAAGTIAALSNYDKILVFVDQSTMKATGQVTLTGNPFRIAADVKHGTVIVASADFTDPANPKTTFASVAPAASPTVKPMTSTSSNLADGFAVSSDGASLYACQRSSCDVQPNQ